MTQVCTCSLKIVCPSDEPIANSGDDTVYEGKEAMTCVAKEKT